MGFIKTTEFISPCLNKARKSNLCKLIVGDYQN